MGRLVVMLNYLSHSLAQGKKAGLAHQPPSLGPGTSANIQAVHISHYSHTGRTLVSCAAALSSQTESARIVDRKMQNGLADTVAKLT